jgi:hypothetical protein
MGVEMTWNDRARALRMNLADGSKMLTPSKRMVVKFGAVSREAVFEGRPLELKF